jgi:ribosomal-protein-alanine N-acetyltransferase
MNSIITEHLELIPLSLEDLKIGLSSLAGLSEKLGFPLATTLFDGTVHRAVTMKITKMSMLPKADYPWFTYWLIRIKTDNFGAGMVGFKGIPNSLGEVEIGYGLEHPFRGHGYMTEAVRALINWAFSHPGCRAVTATEVHLDNFPPQNVLTNAGFTLTRTSETGISYRFEKN